jgi:hypothetical protein
VLNSDKPIIMIPLLQCLLSVAADDCSAYVVRKPVQRREDISGSRSEPLVLIFANTKTGFSIV